MNIAVIVGIGITAAAAAAVLRKISGEFGMMVSLAASLIVLYIVISSLSPLVELLDELSEAAETDGRYIAVLLKALAVCIMTRLAAEFCRDSGEGALASKIELGGKAAVLLCAVPLFRNILEIVKGLII